MSALLQASLSNHGLYNVYVYVVDLVMLKDMG